MKPAVIFTLAALLLAPVLARAASPYESLPESKAGPGVEEVWTDQGVRYYRGLPGTPNTSRPRDASVMPYQPEIEFGTPAPLKDASVNAAPKRVVRKAAPVRKKAPVKVARAKKKPRKAVSRPVAAKTAQAPSAPATQYRDAEAPLPYGADPFSSGGIVGTTRLQ